MKISIFLVKMMNVLMIWTGITMLFGSCICIIKQEYFLLLIFFLIGGSFMVVAGLNDLIKNYKEDIKESE